MSIWQGIVKGAATQYADNAEYRMKLREAAKIKAEERVADLQDQFKVLEKQYELKANLKKQEQEALFGAGGESMTGAFQKIAGEDDGSQEYTTMKQQFAAYMAEGKPGQAIETARKFRTDVRAVKDQSTQEQEQGIKDTVRELDIKWADSFDPDSFADELAKGKSGKSPFLPVTQVGYEGPYLGNNYDPKAEYRDTMTKLKKDLVAKADGKSTGITSVEGKAVGQQVADLMAGRNLLRAKEGKFGSRIKKDDVAEAINKINTAYDSLNSMGIDIVGPERDDVFDLKDMDLYKKYSSGEAGTISGEFTDSDTNKGSNAFSNRGGLNSIEGMDSVTLSGGRTIKVGDTITTKDGNRPATAADISKLKKLQK